MPFVLNSTFANNDYIPRKYTCDGSNVSPPLKWHTAPDATKSFALIVEDPDEQPATWTHWVLYNIPAETNCLSSAFPAALELPDGSKIGRNSWEWTGYNGPCPSDGVHRYVFKLYALDTILEMNAGANKAQLVAAMAGHVLAMTELTGLYSR